MSMVTNYPAKVTSYTIFFSEGDAQIQLNGIEDSQIGAAANKHKEKKIANIDFVATNGEKGQNYKAFINRGGFLQMTRPIYMLPPILVALEQKSDLLLDQKGNLKMHSKTNSLVGQ